MNLPPVPESLRRITPLLEEFAAPSVAFSLELGKATRIGASKLGGTPDLPRDFQMPPAETPLDFLLQIDLTDVSRLDQSALLPKAGLLSFFYDLQKQPWGFDPKDLDGFRIHYTPPGVPLVTTAMARSKFVLNECRVNFRAGLTLPHQGSRIYEQFEKLANLREKEADAYFDYADAVERFGRSKGANHHLLGHSDNIQGDMQLEAQLVTNGLYCGDASGHNDPRWKVLKSGAGEWMLLLQLDSDDTAEFMWGDMGMLYYWIRKGDLAESRFDRAWMGLQCY